MSQKSKKKRRRLSKVRADELSLVGKPAVQGSKFLIAKRDEDQAMSDEASTVVEDVVKDAIEDGTTEDPTKDQDGIVKETVEDVDGDEENLEEEEDAASKKKPKKKTPVKKDGDKVVDIEKGSDAWLQAIRILRNSASDMDPSGLELLAQVIRYTQYAYGDEDKVRSALTKMGIDVEADEVRVEDVIGEHDDVSKAMKVIGPTAFGKISTAAQAIVTNANAILEISSKAREIKKDGDEKASGETADNNSTDVVTKDALESADGVVTAQDGNVAILEKDRPAEPQSEPDLLAAAGDILLKRAAEKRQQSDAAILEALTQVNSRLDVVDDRQSSFAAGLKQATGKL